MPLPRSDLSSALIRVLRELELRKLIPSLAERLRQARERGMDPEDVLLAVLSDEVDRRRNQRVPVRATRATLGRHLANEPGMTVVCESADALLSHLGGARLDGTYSVELRRMAMVQLLIIDAPALRPPDVPSRLDFRLAPRVRRRSEARVARPPNFDAEGVEPITAAPAT